MALPPAESHVAAHQPANCTAVASEIPRKATTSACAAAGGAVCRSVARARSLLGSRRGGTERRLLAPMLSVRHERLCCSLGNLQKQVCQVICKPTR